MKYELPIYGENDEIVKTYATDRCPWGVYVQAAEVQESLKDKSPLEQMKVIGDILKMVFRELTDAELLIADGDDVLNTFVQICNGGQKIKGGNSKNA